MIIGRHYYRGKVRFYCGFHLDCTVNLTSMIVEIGSIDRSLPLAMFKNRSGRGGEISPFSNIGWFSISLSF